MSRTLNTNFFNDYSHNELKFFTYLFILVSKTFNGVTEHAEVQVDNEGIKVLYNVFDDTVGENFLVPFLKELFESILTQSLFTRDCVEVSLQDRVFTVELQILRSAVLLVTFGFNSLES